MRGNGPGPRPAGAALALLCCAAVPAAALATGEAADLTAAEVEPAVTEALARTAGPEGAAEEDAAPPGANPPPDHVSGPDEQTGYYYTFAFAATLGELFGGAGLGLGIASLIDGYDRDGLPGLAATPEDAAELAGDADDLKVLGWCGLGVGALAFGLGFALDYYLADSFGADDWWLRVGVTTPLATAGMALLAGGIAQLDRGAALQTASPRLATLEARAAVRDDAAAAETNGWILIGVGAAAIVGAATVWLKDAFDADEVEPTTDDEDGGPEVALFPLTLPGGGGLGLTLVL